MRHYNRNSNSSHILACLSNTCYSEHPGRKSLHSLHTVSLPGISRRKSSQRNEAWHTCLKASVRHFLDYEMRKDQTGTVSIGKTQKIKLRDFLLAPKFIKTSESLASLGWGAIRYLSETLSDCFGLDSRLEISTGKKSPF